MEKDRWSGYFSDVANFRRHQLGLVITPLIEAASQIQKNFGVNYVSPYLNADVDRRLALRGVGAGLLINCEGIIDSFIAFVEKERGEGLANAYDLGPRIGPVSWARAIWAAANYVRHGDEWWEEVQTLCRELGMINNGIIIFNDEVEARILPWLESKTGNRSRLRAENIRALSNAGLLPRKFLVGGVHFFEVAEFLGLLNLELTLSRFEEYQASVLVSAGYT